MIDHQGVSEIRINPLSLRFNDHDLESEFRIHYARENRRISQLGGAAAIIGFIGFWFVSGYVFSGEAAREVAANVAAYIIPPAVICLAISFLPSYERFMQANIAIWLTIIGASWSFVVLPDMPLGTAYSIGCGVTMTVVFVVYIMLKLRFITSILVGTSITAIYLVSAYQVVEMTVSEGVIDMDAFIAGATPSAIDPYLYQVALLVIANFIAGSGSYLFERLERSNFIKAKVIGRQQAMLEHEKRRSEDLLLNILPGSIATRLKDSPESIADNFSNVSVVFVDIANFTVISGSHAPRDIVDMLNRVFTEFDLIVRKHGLEKIKTIGDAYMAVAGVPVPREDHAQLAALAALEMQRVGGLLCDPCGNTVNFRIGISSGPAVAGVIGAYKFAYDLWGDTVNTASRMESHGEVGKIQISESVHDLIKDEFNLEPRGEISVKGKGSLRTWWLISRK